MCARSKKIERERKIDCRKKKERDRNMRGAFLWFKKDARPQLCEREERVFFLTHGMA